MSAGITVGLSSGIALCTVSISLGVNSMNTTSCDAASSAITGDGAPIAAIMASSWCDRSWSPSMLHAPWRSVAGMAKAVKIGGPYVPLPPPAGPSPMRLLAKSAKEWMPVSLNVRMLGQIMRDHGQKIIGRSRVPGGLFTVGAIWSREPSNV